jgi:outer membrane protein TolC
VYGTGSRFHFVVAFLSFAGLVVTGCRSPAQYRENADKVANKIIAQKQMEALGTTEPIRVERPSDILRRRLIEQQQLPVSSTASLGTDRLAPIPHWPDKTYPPEAHSPDANIPIEPNQPVKITLIDALEIAAHNSPEYQSRKEDVFRTALALDLSRNNFRYLFSAGADSQISTDTTRDPTVTAVESGASAGVTRLFQNGAALTTAIGIDLVNLLTQGGASSLGLNLDTSVSIPLLRGAGRYIVLEPLTQAERDVVYEIWDFERYKRTFAVNIATNYLNVLQQLDSLDNNVANYKSAIQSARSSRRQGDAGRLKPIDVDLAVQRELQSRAGWIRAQQQFENRLDSFKILMGLPTDAGVELDPNDLDPLQKRGDKYVEAAKAAYKAAAAETAPPADAPVVLVPASKEDAGPYEINERLAIDLALDHRLDLRIANGGVYDAQRQVIVAADALRTGLTLTGSAGLRGDDDSGGVSVRGGRYSAGLVLNLPIERTRERNAYRNSLINLERATRSVQTLEDQIKSAIRSELRTLVEARENVKISAQSVVIAENSVANAELQLDAGRLQIRDLLDTQDQLLSAKNGLTAAIISYRTAELQIQRDMDLLQITQQGLLKEFSPEEIKYGYEQQHQN